MTFAGLAVRGGFRNPLRTLLTSLGVAIAVVAFLFLRTLIAAYYVGVESAASDRLVTRNKISITFTLPVAYRARIAAVPGVSDLTIGSWFGGIYIDEKNFFGQVAVEPESFLRVFPEILLGDEERRAWIADRQGAIVGETLAQKYNWKPGDRIALRGDIYPGDWQFTIRGIYRGRDRSTDVQSMYFHWKYLDEQVDPEKRSQVGLFLARVADPTQGPRVAHAVDALFANSLAETRTESEKAFQLSFMSMSGAVLTAIQLVSAVMLAILMLILGNSIAMSTRERISEYAVMRCVGFRSSHIVALVLGEGLMVALLGFGLGLGLAPFVLRGFADWGQNQFGNFLGAFSLSPRAVALAGIASVLGGLISTGVPARAASRLSIVDGLRRVE